MWPPEDQAGVQLAVQGAQAFVPEQTAGSTPGGCGLLSPGLVSEVAVPSFVPGAGFLGLEPQFICQMSSSANVRRK